MTASRRMKVRTICGSAALMALGLASPARSQDASAPVVVTAAPPASPETVGPSQLQDFTLQGTVTRPSEGPAAAPARPATTAPATPRPDEAVPGEAAAALPASRTDTSVARPQLTPTTPVRTGTDRIGSTLPEPVTPSQPLEVRTGPAPQPGVGSSNSPIGVDLEPTGGSFPWPWLAALVALIAGGAFIIRSRQNRRTGYGDAGRMAFVGPQADPVPRPQPGPPVRPRADPVPPRGDVRQAPRPVPAPAPEGRPGFRPGQADDGLVVSTRFKPELNVQFMPDRMVITPTEAVLQFDVVITNAGSAPARDVLVEAKMFTAHAAQDQEIASFFHLPAASGDRIPAIAPLGKLSLKSVVRIPLDDLRSFEAAGRKLFVPLVGFNILFRAGSGEGQASASFLVGRGGEEDEKLAPFRLDLGPRVFRGLSARPHSLGLQPA